MDMTQVKPKTRKALAKLVANSYNILSVLYPNKQMSITDIAKELDDSAANVSRTINALHENALIVTRELREESKGGLPKKICSLTYKAAQIVEIIEEPIKPSLTDEQITTLITILEDKTLSCKTRKTAAGTLTEHSPSISESLLRNQRVRTMFKQAISNYLNEDEIKKGTLSILSASLPYIQSNQETAEWFRKNLYQDILRITQDPKAPKPLQETVIGMLARTARLSNNPDTVSQITKALLSLYFENQDLSEAVRNEFIQFEPKFQLRLIEEIRQRTKNEDHKTAAEELLQALIKYWWGKDLSRTAAANT
jgi:predicted transcriptional regulator